MQSIYRRRLLVPSITNIKVSGICIIKEVATLELNLILTTPLV